MLKFKTDKIFLLVFFHSIVLLAQDGSERMFRKYSTKNGLLNNGIYSLQQSDNGLWWIGTGVGLQRFDGYSFENWNESADTTIKTNSGAQNVFEDSKGNVWVFNFGTHYVFPSSSKKYTLVTADTSKVIPALLYYPIPVMEKDGRIWCYQENAGFIGLNMETKKADTLVSVTFRSRINENLQTLPFSATDGSGHAWVVQDFADSSYIFRFKPGMPLQKTVLSSAKYGQVKGYIPITDSTFLFISTAYTAIYPLNDFDHPVKILSRENIPGNFLRGLPFEELKVHNKGSIIFPGEKGIYEYVSSTQTLQLYSTSAYPSINLTRQFMFALREDAQGNIWIGRDGSDGLLVFYPGKLKFDFLKAPPQYFNLVYSLAVDEKGNVFASNFQKGLNVFDKKGKWKHYIELPKIENGYSPSIRAVGFIDRNHLVMKSLMNNLMVLNTDDYSVMNISSLFPEKVAKQKNVFDANFFKIHENELHFTHGNYILGIVKSGSSYSVSIVDSLPNQTVTSIAYSSGKRFVGTLNGCYAKEGNAWKKIAGTENFPVKMVTIGKDGLIWAVGSHGIMVIKENQVIKKFNESTGLLNEFIYGVLFDDDGNAWYSSNKGLGCIQKNGSIKFLTEADGLQGDEFDTQSFWKDANGKMYFGGINGITSFYPNSVLQPDKPGNIILSSMMINGEGYPSNGRLEHVASMELPFHQNNLSFTFSLTDFSDAAYNVYKVKMDGFNEDWVNLKNINTIRYLLAPGDYTFHIIGSSDGNTWSNEFILPIIITPAWWQTLWFRWLTAIATVVVTVIIVTYYNKIRTTKLRQQLELQTEMQKERDRISRDLHDSIGAYSSALIANTDSLDQLTLSDESKIKILYLKENARNILSAIRETIWLLNSDNLTVTGFTEGFINYCINILRQTEGIEIEFKEDIIDNKNLLPAVAIHLLRILQEVIQNILKHANATMINCYIKSDEQFLISITDNGKGFDTNQKQIGNGLKNMKYRTNEIDFDFIIKSKVGKGTEVIIVSRR